VNRIEVAITFAGLLAIFVVGYSIYIVSSTVKQMRPLVQTSNDMEVMIVSVHLWFEEAMQGDKSIDINRQVYGNIDAAITAVNELQTQIQQSEPEVFRQIEGRLNELRSKLRQWREQTQERWKDPVASAPGTPSDQAYDALFKNILQLCTSNKSTIDAIVLQRQKTLTKINASLIVFMVLMFTTLIMLSFRYHAAMRAKNLTVLKLSQAVEQTDDLVTITDKEGLIEYVNPAFEKLTGFKSSDAIGKKTSILKSGQHDASFYQRLWRVIIGGKPFRSEIINKKKNGELFFEEKTISPIRDPEGIITHYVSTGKDVTEQKKIENELIHSREMKMIGQLASGVAHEVRNPLNAILAISEALCHEFSGEPGYAEYLDRIRGQVNRLSALMRDLLELGKPIPESTMQKTSLVKLCESSIELWKQYDARSHPVQLVPGVDNGKAKILANRQKMQQVLVNLLDNAAQHSPQGAEIRIVIDEPVDNRVRLRVQDHGSGISSEKSEQLFEPFFTTRKSGTGLGLSIVKHIVEIHGGTVSIRNNDSTPGCSVEIIIPVTGDIEKEPQFDN
jgi:PAS domain S-box-containing protein